MPNLNLTITKIHELSTFKPDQDQSLILYNLGLIHGMCQTILDEGMLAITPSAEPKSIKVPKIAKEIQVQNLFSSEAEGIELSVSGTEVQKTNKAELPDIAKYLERRASHMNLKFEISNRWINKNYAKAIIDILYGRGITTITDFVEIFDNYKFYNAIKYPNTASKLVKQDLAKVFPYSGFTPDDLQKFALLYTSCNENGDTSDYNILRNFLAIGNKKAADKDCYIGRYANNIVRNGITNINQLALFLKENGLKGFEKLSGIGHINDNVKALYEYVSNN